MEIKESIKGFITGFKTAVRYWHDIVFNYKIPMGICWLIAIMLIPINVILALVGLIFYRSFLINVCKTAYDDIDEREEA